MDLVDWRCHQLCLSEQRKIANHSPSILSEQLPTLNLNLLVMYTGSVESLIIVGSVAPLVQDADRLESMRQDFRLLGGHTW